MKFWVWMVAIWVFLALDHTFMPSSIVWGMGLIFCFVGGVFLAWEKEFCYLVMSFFIVLSVIQLGFKTTVLDWFAPARIYANNFPENDNMATPRADRDLALSPHGALYGWLKRLEPIEAESAVENCYGRYLKENNLTDSKESFDKWVEDYNRFEGHIENTPGFGRNIQRGLVYRHMKYHGCTWKELLENGKRLTREDSYRSCHVDEDD